MTALILPQMKQQSENRDNCIIFFVNKIQNFSHV